MEMEPSVDENKLISNENSELSEQNAGVQLAPVNQPATLADEANCPFKQLRTWLCASEPISKNGTGNESDATRDDPSTRMKRKLGDDSNQDQAASSSLPDVAKRVKLIAYAAVDGSGDGSAEEDSRGLFVSGVPLKVISPQEASNCSGVDEDNQRVLPATHSAVDAGDDDDSQENFARRFDVFCSKGTSSPQHVSSKTDDSKLGSAVVVDQSDGSEDIYDGMIETADKEEGAACSAVFGLAKSTDNCVGARVEFESKEKVGSCDNAEQIVSDCSEPVNDGSQKNEAGAVTKTVDNSQRESFVESLEGNSPAVESLGVAAAENSDQVLHPHPCVSDANFFSDDPVDKYANTFKLPGECRKVATANDEVYSKAEDDGEFRDITEEVDDDDEEEGGYDVGEADFNYNERQAAAAGGAGGHEYDVLDELTECDDDQEDDGSSATDDDCGWSDGEVDAMLDLKLEESRQRKTDPVDNDVAARSESEGDEDVHHERREKVILKVRGQDHFEVLPEGWLEVTHISGMPMYLHKHTRVCTLSKPYFLGPGSARKHEVPISAIPCLQYRKELEREQQQDDLENEGEKQTCPMMDVSSTIPDDPVDSLSTGTVEPRLQNDTSSGILDTSVDTTSAECGQQNGSNLPNAKIQTVQENTREKSIDGMKLRNYCSRLFEFQTITVRRFKTWAGRRKHQKKMKQMHRPTLPIGTKLITCPLPPVPDKKDGVFVNPRRAEFVMNPNGKSYVCILHEYVQHAMRVQPRYTFKELENASTPYGATVLIGNMKYGSGFGSSKKHAKLEAAKATLMILIPQMENINPDDKSVGTQQDFVFFDEIRVEDPRISELCAKAGQSSPYQILLECLRRNHGMGDTQIKFEMHTLKHQKNEFKMTVGKHVAKVICKNKRDGKQRASQAILQILHPHIPKWGSLLRLYGKGSCRTLKEKKVEEQLITELQARTTQNKPNKAILNKLKEEMLKLKTKQNLVKPIGKFLSGDLEPPSSSGSNLKNVDL